MDTTKAHSPVVHQNEQLILAAEKRLTVVSGKRSVCPYVFTAQQISMCNSARLESAEILYSARAAHLLKYKYRIYK